MGNAFKTSETGKRLIKDFEKCFLKTYRVGGRGNPTIGWGQEHWLFPNTPGAIRVVDGLIITQKQADDAFDFFVHNVVDPLVWEHFNADTQEEHDALASWVYNIRHERLELPDGHPNAYNLRRIFNAKPRDLDAIVLKWIQYCNPKTPDEKGLYRHRLAELCLLLRAPWTYAWTATVRRSNDGTVIERTDPWHVLEVAQHEAKVSGSPYPTPIPSLPDPPKAPEPVIEVEEEALPEIPEAPNVDLSLPPKPLEESKTHKGLSKKESGQETVAIGTTLGGLSLILPHIEALTSFLEKYPATSILSALTVIGVIVAGVGGWRWWAGKMIAHEGRLEATTTKV